MLAIRLPKSVENVLKSLLAERALERIRNGEDRTIPLEKVMKRHGMKD
jgi:predicted DNA-binding protein